MDVDDACKENVLFVPERILVFAAIRKIHIPYVFSSQLAISFKISVSDLVVSSKPGVSTKTMLSLPSLYLTASMFAVYDFKACPARRPPCRTAVSMN